MDQYMLNDNQKRILGRKLRDAREARGWTQEDAAKAIDVARTTLINIEQGKRSPSVVELAKLAHEYGRDVSELLRQPKDFSAADIQFRAVQVDIEAPEAEQTFKELSQDYYDLERLLDIEPTYSYPREYSTDNLRLEQAAESIANRERNRLGMGDQPISSNFRDTLENVVGLRVFYFPMSAISGMYFFTDALGGCIAINQQARYEERRRWNMAHEYGHFLMSRYKSNVVVYSDEGMPIKSENDRLADAFARYFLMPTSSVTLRFNELVKEVGRFSPAALCIMANEYGVSVQAMALRLEGERLLPTGTYDRLIEQGFKPRQALEKLRLAPIVGRDDLLPTRFKYLAVQAFLGGKINEGRLATLLRVDRLDARRIADALAS